MNEPVGTISVSVPKSISPSALRRMLQNEHFMKTMMACWDIYDHKGADYTRGKGDLDRSDNFKQAAENIGIKPLQAWGVYFYKHVSAVWRFVKDGKVESEPIEGRIYDVINYSILLLLLIQDLRAQVADSPPDRVTATVIDHPLLRPGIRFDPSEF